MSGYRPRLNMRRTPSSELKKKGTFPQSRKYVITPRLQTSLIALYMPDGTSGAMYASVPASERAPTCESDAKPKSVSTTSVSLFLVRSRKFSALMSRWMMFWTVCR